jgi:hypothetical protein
MRLKLLPILVGGFILISCSPSFEAQTRLLEKVVEWNQIGPSKDVWLIKQSTPGEDEKVALVFGFVDDYEFCREVAEAYMLRYPASRYSCVIAN